MSDLKKHRNIAKGSIARNLAVGAGLLAASAAGTLGFTAVGEQAFGLSGKYTDRHTSISRAHDEFSSRGAATMVGQYDALRERNVRLDEGQENTREDVYARFTEIVAGAEKVEDFDRLLDFVDAGYGEVMNKDFGASEVDANATAFLEADARVGTYISTTLATLGGAGIHGQNAETFAAGIVTKHAQGIASGDKFRFVDGKTFIGTAPISSIAKRQLFEDYAAFHPALLADIADTSPALKASLAGDGAKFIASDGTIDLAPDRIMARQADAEQAAVATSTSPLPPATRPEARSEDLDRDARVRERALAVASSRAPEARPAGLASPERQARDARVQERAKAMIEARRSAAAAPQKSDQSQL